MLRRVCLAITLSVSLPASAEYELPHWPKYPSSVASSNIRELIKPSELPSCDHLRHRIKSNYDVITNIGEIMAFQDEDLSDAFEYHRQIRGIDGYKAAAQDAYMIEWNLDAKIVKETGLKNAQALMILSVDQLALSDTSKRFSTPRRQVRLKNGTAQVRAAVNALDICHAGELSLVVLNQCPIDRFVYSTCDLEDCYAPQPMVHWAKCKEVTEIPLDLKGVAEIFGKRSQRMKRGG